jgi:hypothetical protein
LLQSFSAGETLFRPRWLAFQGFKFNEAREGSCRTKNCENWENLGTAQSLKIEQAGLRFDYPRLFWRQ